MATDDILIDDEELSDSDNLLDSGFDEDDEADELVDADEPDETDDADEADDGALSQLNDGARPHSRAAWDKARTKRLFRRYKEHGDESAREQLVMNHINLVRYLAAKFKNRGEPLDDLIQVGTIGLIKAIDRFDLSRGLEFTTYATPTILGEIKRHFRDKGWAVRVPRRLQELSAKVNQATDDLTAELQRSPSVDEIAAQLGISVDEVLEAMESSSAYSSIPLEGGGTDDEAPSVLDHYADEDRDLGFADDRMLLEELMEELTPREREVLAMRFDEGLTQAEIASRLGISQVQVSRLLRRTLQKAQERIDPHSTSS